MTRRPGGRSNGAGRGPRMPRPRGSNAGPSRTGCGRSVAVAVAVLLVLARRVRRVRPVTAHPATRRRLAAVAVLAAVLLWMLDADWGPNMCDRTPRPAVSSR